jgi:uncharacterized protein YcbX
MSTDGVVTGLFVYPVKACRGIELKTAMVERRGLQHDRRFMIVDETGRFVTQRTEPRLALVDVSIRERDGELVLAAPGLPALHVDVTEAGRRGERRRVQVWRDPVDAVDCGEAARAWVSQWLGKPMSLVYMPDDVERLVNPKYGGAGDIVSFADGYPVLLASTSSLEDVNARLAQPVPMDRFRPNLVVSGCAPWAEDGWAHIRVGEVAFRVVKACDRCTVTTVDQRTAEQGVEPLRTLATFRKKDNDVLFAQNCIPDSPGAIGHSRPALSPLGSIAVGDCVAVVS